jgi:hypothetical protein
MMTTKTETSWTEIEIAELEAYLLDPTADREEAAYAALALREARTRLEILTLVD